MSSSYRKSMRTRGATSTVLVFALAIGLPSGVTLAAETYVQPQLDLFVESNDNWELAPGGSGDNVMGYTADAQALIGIATARSDTSIRPRLTYATFPDADQDWVNGFLDFKSQYLWERSQFYAIARYAYEDIYDVRIADAAFDDFDPEDPNVPDTARQVVGETSKRFSFAPSYAFSWSELTTVGVGAFYQQSRYDGDTQEDYDFVLGEVYFARTLNPKSELRVTPYASYFEVKESDGGQTTAYGLSVGYKYRWSEISGLEASVRYEENDLTDYIPEKTSETSSGFGGNFTAYLNGTRDQWRFVLDSGWYPSGDGGMQETDQVRLQYLRDLTQRLQFNGAARYLRTRALNSSLDTDDRDYARLELSLRWMVSPTWYVGGGYNLSWQEYVIEEDSADNNQFFLSCGYLGLGRKPR